MSPDRLPLGVFTTDEHLVVRTWDGWMAAVTRLDSANALNRPVIDVLPGISPTGLVVMEEVLARERSK